MFLTSYIRINAWPLADSVTDTGNNFLVYCLIFFTVLPLLPFRPNYVIQLCNIDFASCVKIAAGYNAGNVGWILSAPLSSWSLEYNHDNWSNDEDYGGNICNYDDIDENVLDGGQLQSSCEMLSFFLEGRLVSHGRGLWHHVVLVVGHTQMRALFTQPSYIYELCYSQLQSWGKIWDTNK